MECDGITMPASLLLSGEKQNPVGGNLRGERSLRGFLFIALFAALGAGLHAALPAPEITGCSDDTGVAGDHITTDTTLILSGRAPAAARITISENGRAL